MRRTEVGPFAEVRLAQNDRARRTQPFDDECVSSPRDIEQRQRARGRLHLIGGLDVVFDQHRHAVERTARRFRSQFPITRIGNRQRIGIDLDDRA